MSIQTITWAWEAKPGSPKLKLVLILLANDSNSTHIVSPNVERLSEECETTQADIVICLKRLTDSGFIRWLGGNDFQLAATTRVPGDAL